MAGESRSAATSASGSSSHAKEGVSETNVRVPLHLMREKGGLGAMSAGGFASRARAEIAERR